MQDEQIRECLQRIAQVLKVDPKAFVPDDHIEDDVTEVVVGFALASRPLSREALLRFAQGLVAESSTTDDE